MGKWGWLSRDTALDVDTVAVIGLGRFGQALAFELMDMGTEVLAVDTDADVIQALNTKVTHAVAGEASVLVTSLLLSMGVKSIWAKAVSEAHGRILEQLGVEHVIYPETEMGRRVAHLLRESAQDYIDLGDGLALVRTTVPSVCTEKTIGEIKEDNPWGISIIAIKHGDEPWQDTDDDTMLLPGDQIMITGSRADAEEFHRMQ